MMQLNDLEKKIKISAVSYLNTLPFVYGLQHTDIRKKTELSLDVPFVCAEKLLSGQTDIGLVPVAVLPDMAEYHIISDFCIGATGMVKSVMLFSEVPLHEIKNIYLDRQSRTSVALVRILAKKFWKINPVWLHCEDGYENKISGYTAGVVIGDRALLLQNKFKFSYDFAGEWIKFTHLPFVFACWTANKKLPVRFVAEFEKALAYGIKNIEKVILHYKEKVGSSVDLHDYFTNNISYTLDNEKRKGMELFLNYLKNE